MNRIHRLIYSARLRTLIPVAENTACCGKSGAAARCRGTLVRCAVNALLLALPWPALAGTLPTGGTVSAGSGSISVAGNTLTVQQNTAKLAINWQSYSIGADSKVVYRQPGADSVALNRVLGGSRSEIYGGIEANGKVFLINPNGVLFGPGAEVNVGGLVATTMSLSDADFIAGKYTFQSGSGEIGEVINQGQLAATPGGFIVLAGRQVSNTGKINAPQGTAALAAGETVTLDIDSAGALKIRVDGATLNALINNQGLIAADGGQVYLTARGKEMAQRSVINVEGIVQARSIGTRNGRIVIDGGSDGAVVARDAMLDVSGLAAGETGGAVSLTGNDVGLFGTSTVDARGAAGGGTVLVGGDYQGGGDLAHAQATVMGSAARIDASATAAGNGGRVVLWSDSYTGFNGQIAARGGAQAGDGGTVETSSRNNLQAFGTVSASAPAGQAGTWLLDPTNVTIVAGTTNANDADGGSGTWTPSASGAQIGATNINNELNAGTSVTINTASGLAEAGDITVNAAIAKTGGADTSLTLNAAGSVVLNAGISATTGQLATTLNAGIGSVSGSGAINTNGGLLTVNSATAGTLSGVISGSGGLTKTGAGTLSLTGAETYTGSTTVGAGTLSLGSGGTTGSIASALAVTINAGANLVINRSNAVSLANSIDGAGNLIKSGTGVATLSGSNTYSGTTTVSGGTLQFANSSALYGGNTANWTAANLIVNSGATLAVNYGGAGEFTSAQLDLLAGLGTATGGFLNGSSLGIDTSSGSQTYASVIANTNGGSNAIGIMKLGGNTLTLAGANTYTGATAISAGTLQAGSSSALGSNSAVTMPNNVAATLDLNGNAIVIGSLTQTGGAGVGIVTNSSTTAATLTLGGNNSSTGYYGQIRDGASVPAGTISLIKQGSGTLTLADVTYTGSTTVAGGTLSIGGGGSIGSLSASSLVTVNSGATLAFNRSNSTTVANVISGAGNVANTGSGTTTLTGASTYTGTTTVSAGTLRFTQAAALYGGDTSQWTAGNLIVRSAATLAVSYGGTGEFTAAQLDVLKGLGTASGGFMSGASLGIDTGSGSQTYSSVIANTNGGANAIGITKLGANTLTLTGNNTYTGTTRISAGILQVGNGGTTGSLGSGAVVDSAGLVFNRSDNLTVANAISGAGSVTQNGGGILTLSGANTYTGATAINAGTLQAGSTTALGSNSALTLANAAGVTLDLNGRNLSIGSLAGGGTGGTVTNSGAAATLTVGGNNTSTVFAGTLQDGAGALALTKTGTGMLTLSGSSAYTGVTTVSGGTLEFAQTAALYGGNSASWTTTNLVVNSGATLAVNYGGSGEFTSAQIDLLKGLGTASGGFKSGSFLGIDTSSGDQSYASAIANPNTGTNVLGLVKLGANTLTLTGANTYTGATTVKAGTLSIGDGGTSGALAAASAVTVNSGATLAFNRSDALTFSNTIGGAGNVANNGSGTTTLGGTNTYSGSTTVNAGGLKAGSTSAFGSSSLSLASGGSTVIDLNGFNLTLGALTGLSGLVTNSGAAATLTVGNSGSATYGGVIQDGTGVLSLVKVGTGTQTLTGTNTYTGTTTVNAGTLAFGKTASLYNGDTSSWTASKLIVNSGATLAVNYGGSGEFSAAQLDLLKGLGGATGGFRSGASLGIDTSSGSQTYSSVIADTNGGANTLGITKLGANTLTLTGANTFGGTTTVSGGTLQLGDGSATTTGLGNGAVVNNATLAFDYNGPTTLNTAMSGSGTFANIGSGRVTLSTALAATTDGNGNTTATVAGGTAGITFSSNKTINVQGRVTLTSFNSTGAAGDTWIHSTAPGTEITIDGAIYSKWIGTSSDGPVGDSLANCLAWAPDVIVNAGAFVSVPYNDRVTYIHNLSGAGNYSVDGRFGSSTYITGSSTLSGTITLLTKAVLQIGVGGAGGNAGATNIVASTSDNQVIFNSTTDATYSGTIGGPATVIKNGSNTLTMTGNNTYAATVINAGTLRVGGGGTTGTLGSGSVVDNANLVFDRSDTVSLSSLAASGVSSSISGTGNLTALVGGGLTVDRPISLSGTNSALTLEAGVGVAAGNATGGDVVLASPVSTSNTGSIAIFSGHPDTATLSSMMSGATGATQYKTYNAASGAVAGTVAGTRNFYYRAVPSLTVSGLTASKTYDGSNSATGTLSGGSVSGNVDGDAAYGMTDLALASATFGDRNAGSKTLLATYTAPTRTNGGWSVSGYSVSPYSAAGAGTISPATIASVGGITASNKVYDGSTGATLNTGSAIFSGMIAGDTLTVGSATGTFSDKNAGPGKTVSISGITLSGADASNYTLASSSASTTASITPKDLIIDLHGQGSKVYDGTTTISLNGVTPTLSGIIGGDAVGIATGSVVGFVTPDAGVNKAVTYTGFGLSGLDAANYTLGNGSSATSTATISPRPVILAGGIAAYDKAYDGSTTAVLNLSGAWFSNLLPSDTLTVASAQGAYSDPFPGIDKQVIVSGIALGGTSASNYILVGSSELIYGDITGRVPIDDASLVPMLGSLCISSSDTSCVFRWPAQEPPRENERIDATQSAESATLERRSRGFSNSKILIRNRGIRFGDGLKCRPGGKTLCLSGVSVGPMPRLARLDAGPETR